MIDPVLGRTKEGNGGRADGEVTAAEEEAAYRRQRKRNCDICLHVDKRDRGGAERQSQTHMRALTHARTHTYRAVVAASFPGLCCLVHIKDEFSREKPLTMISLLGEGGGKKGKEEQGMQEEEEQEKH